MYEYENLGVSNWGQRDPILSPIAGSHPVVTRSGPLGVNSFVERAVPRQVPVETPKVRWFSESYSESELLFSFFLLFYFIESRSDKVIGGQRREGWSKN